MALLDPDLVIVKTLDPDPHLFRKYGSTTRVSAPYLSRETFKQIDFLLLSGILAFYPALKASSRNSSVADPDPGSSAFWTPGSGIRNRFFPDPGSDHYS